MIDFKVNELTYQALEIKLNQIVEWIGENHNERHTVEKYLDQIDEIVKKEQIYIFENFNPQFFLKFCEEKIKIQYKLEGAESYLVFYLKHHSTQNHFKLKTLMLLSKICSIRAYNKDLILEGKLVQIDQSLQYLEKAIQIIEESTQLQDQINKNKKDEKQDTSKEFKYQFMIFNLSITVYDILKNFFREENMMIFNNIIVRLYQLMDKYLQGQQFWKQQFTWIFFASTYFSNSDANKQKDNLNTLENLWKSLPQSPSSQIQVIFKETLFKQRIHFSLQFPQYKDQIKKELSDRDEKWKHLYQLQMIKTGQVNSTMIEKEINNFLIEINKNQDKKQQEETQLKQQYSDIYAEIARISIHYGIKEIADQLLSALKSLNGKSRKCLFLMELARAELMILNLQTENMNNLKKLTVGQIKDLNIKNRKEAIDIICNTLKTYKSLPDPQTYYEACILVWNMSLPFLNQQYDIFLEKVFIEASRTLEMIFCNDYELRINFLYELARMNSQQHKIKEATQYVQKAMELSNYTRNYLSQKLEELKMDLQLQSGSFTNNLLEKFDNEKLKIQFKDLFNIKKQFNDILKKQSQKIKKSEVENLFDNLVNIDQQNLQDENVSINEENDYQNLTLQRLQRQVAFELLTLASQENFHLLCSKIGNFLLNETQEQNQETNILCVKTHFILIKNKISYLTENNQHFAFQQEEKIKQNMDDFGFDLKNPQDIQQLKKEIFDHFTNALNKSILLKQNWLIFNVGIILWNNFLPVFKNSQNDSKLHEETEILLKKIVDHFMSIIKSEEKKNTVDYDLEKKIQIFGNITIIYCRLLENKKEFEQVKEVCQNLLLSTISQQMRKLVNSIIARMDTKLQSNNQKQQKNQKNELILDKRNQLQHEIIFKIEAIQNHTNPQEISQQLESVYKMMLEYIEKAGNEITMSILVELWTKIANLALIQNTFPMTTFSINCLERIFELKEKNNDIQKTVQDYKWLSYAEYLYGKASYMIAQIEGIEFQEKYCLLFQSLKHFIKCNNKALKSNNKKMIFQSVERFYQIVQIIFNEFQDNESLNLLPKTIYTLLFQIKQANLPIEEMNMSDKYSQMYINILNIFYHSTLESQEWQQLKEGCDFLLDYINVEYRKEVWFIKIKALANLQISEEDLMNQIREFDCVLQAKYLIQIANLANAPKFQYFALKKAIHILKTEKKPEIVEVLIDLSYFLYQQKIKKNKIFSNLYKAIDIIYKTEKGFDDKAKNQTLVKDVYYQPFSFQIRQKEVFPNFNQRQDVMNDMSKLDKLFRIHVLCATFCSIKQHQIMFLKDSFYFMYQIIKLNHQNLHDSNFHNSLVSSEKLGTQNQSSKSFPSSIEEWFDYILNQNEVKLCQLDHNKCLINKIVFEKPLVSINSLRIAIKYYYDQNMFYQCVVLLSILENFERIIFNTNYYRILCLSYKISIAQKLGKNELEEKYTQILNSEDWLQYFKVHLEKNQVKIHYHHLFNQSQDVNRKIVIQNEFQEWETWLDVSKILYDCGMIQLSYQFILSYKKICQFHKFSNQIDICQLLVSLIQNKIGMIEVSQDTCLQIVKNISSIEEFKWLLKLVMQIFFNKKEHNQCYDAFTKIEDILVVFFNNFEDTEINHSHKKELLCLVRLWQCQAYLQEFEIFQQRAMIENEENYFENFNRMYKVVLKNFQDIFNLCQQNIDFNVTKTFIDTLQMIFEQLSQIKIFTKKILNYLYLILNVIVQNLITFKNMLENHLTNIKEQQKFDVKLYSHIRKNSLIQNQLVYLDFLWCKFLNFKNNFKLNFPYIDQKKFESQIFQEESIANQQKEQEGIFNLIKQYIYGKATILQENQFLQKIRVILNDLLDQDNNFFFTQEVKLEKIRIDLVYDLKQDQEEEIDLNTDNILDDLDREENQNQLELQSQKNKQMMKEKFIQDLIGLDCKLEDFCSLQYFSFQQRRILLILLMCQDLKKEIECDFIIQFQNIAAQEYFIKFLLQYSNNSVYFKHELSKILHSKKKPQKFSYEIFNKILKELDVNEVIRKLPTNSYYIIFQHEQNYQHFMMALFYIDNNGQKINLLQALENSQEINQELKTFYRKSFISSQVIDDADKENESQNQQSHQSIEDKQEEPQFLKDILLKNDFKIISQKMAQISQQINQHFESLQQEDDKKKKPNEQENVINGIYLLLDKDYLDLPFEYFLDEQLIKKSKGIFRNYSTQSLLEIQRESNLVDQQFVNIINPNVSKFNEILEPLQQLQTLVPQSVKKTDKQIVTDIEWNNYLANNHFFYFQGNYDFFKYHNITRFINNLQNHKTKVFFCFDRMKLFEKEYLKYVHRRELEVNYVRSKIFFSLCYLSGMIYAVFPRYNFTSQEFLSMIEIIEAIKLQDEIKLRNKLEEMKNYLNFTMFGNPYLVFDEKKKKQ